MFFSTNRSNSAFVPVDSVQDKTVGIPLTVTLLVIGGYILMGTATFGIWEKWEAMEAAYFCFVTISTIGFGDVVPGAAAGVVNKGGAVKMIVDGVYILFGLAMISMAFNLIQVSRQFTALRRSLVNY